MKDKILKTALENLKAIAGVEYRMGDVEKVKSALSDKQDYIVTLIDTDAEYSFDILMYKQIHKLGNIYSHVQSHYERTNLTDVLIVAEYITPKLRAELKKRKLCYLEVSGNCFIHRRKKSEVRSTILNNTLKMIISGENNNPYRSKTKDKAFQEAGLKLTLALFAEDGLLNLPYRYISNKANIAVGSIKSIIDDLEDKGYLTTGKRLSAKRRRKLEENWMEGYSAIKSNFIKGYFSCDMVKEIREDKLIRISGSGKSDNCITLYSSRSISYLTKHYCLTPDENGNVELVQMFWKDHPYWIENSEINQVVSQSDYYSHANRVSF